MHTRTDHSQVETWLKDNYTILIGEDLEVHELAVHRARLRCFGSKEAVE